MPLDTTAVVVEFGVSIPPLNLHCGLIRFQLQFHRKKWVFDCECDEPWVFGYESDEPWAFGCESDEPKNLGVHSVGLGEVTVLGV